MGNTLTIFRRELGSYFNSPIAYIVITVFLLISGYLYFSQVFLVGEATLRDFFGITPLIFIFFGPAVTMRLLAEEKRTGTLEVLVTMPVTDWHVVLGKFFAALAVIMVAILLTLAYPVTLSSFGDLDWGAVVGGYLGLVLLAGAYVAIGVMTSSWTRDQVVSFIIAFGITFSLYLLGKMVPLMPSGLAPIVEYMTLDSHFNNIAKGVIDSRDVIYYVSLIGACLFLATQSLDSRRWR
jgi:ABC-2 type transport system permease protein